MEEWKSGGSAFDGVGSGWAKMGEVRATGRVVCYQQGGAITVGERGSIVVHVASPWIEL